MNKYTNEYDKECYSGVTPDLPFNLLEFHQVDCFDEGDTQVALHTNLGSLTVVDRMTGFGWRDIETGYRAKNGEFWLATGNCDVRESGCETIQEAIDWVKGNANTCIGKD